MQTFMRHMMCRSAVIVALVATMTACRTQVQPGDPASGARIFNGEIAIHDDVGGCATCHSLVPGELPSLGPNLSNIGNRAGTTRPDTSAETYLHQSIVDPDAFLVTGYQEGIMPRNYRTILSAQQIEDLITYMLTLQSGQD